LRNKGHVKLHAARRGSRSRPDEGLGQIVFFCWCPLGQSHGFLFSFNTSPIWSLWPVLQTHTRRIKFTM